MVVFTIDERLALLLNVLGDDVAAAAFKSMDAKRASDIRKLLDDYRSDPPSTEEIEYVIGDFNQYFQFAMQQLDSEFADSTDNRTMADPTSPAEKAGPIYFAKLTPSHDPIHDLDRLDPFQIAMAIENDHPKTVAIVLRNMDSKQAANVLAYLTTEVRTDALVFLTQECTVPAPIVNQVLKTTVINAVSVEYREEVVDQSQTLAELMRSLPKEMRVELMDKLEETNPELSESVKTKLYLFSDVLRMEDRDVQKLLSEIESDSLIVALQRTEQELIDKLLVNLSKRARESITEEMQYKVNATDEEVEEARGQLIEAIARLDESGEIRLK